MGVVTFFPPSLLPWQPFRILEPLSVTCSTQTKLINDPCCAHTSFRGPIQMTFPVFSTFQAHLCTQLDGNTELLAEAPLPRAQPPPQSLAFNHWVTLETEHTRFIWRESMELANSVTPPGHCMEVLHPSNYCTGSESGGKETVLFRKALGQARAVWGT